MSTSNTLLVCQLKLENLKCQWPSLYPEAVERVSKKCKREYEATIEKVSRCKHELELVVAEAEVAKNLMQGAMDDERSIRETVSSG